MAISPDEPGLACFIGAKDYGGGGDIWSYKTCKAPVKLSLSTNQCQTFYRLDSRLLLEVGWMTDIKYLQNIWHQCKVLHVAMNCYLNWGGYAFIRISLLVCLQDYLVHKHYLAGFHKIRWKDRTWGLQKKPLDFCGNQDPVTLGLEGCGGFRVVVRWRNHRTPC